MKFYFKLDIVDKDFLLFPIYIPNVAFLAGDRMLDDQRSEVLELYAIIFYQLLFVVRQ